MTNIQSVNMGNFKVNATNSVSEDKNSTIIGPQNLETSNESTQDDFDKNGNVASKKNDADKRAQEFQAIRAKYGVNLQKTDDTTNCTNQNLPDIANYANVPTPKLKPTNKPIVKYTTKDNEKMLAREVQLENGYTCIAIANEKNPSQVTLMNKDEFQKFFKENAKQRAQSVGNKVQKGGGSFADKSFEIECVDGIKDRLISGTIDNLNFTIKHTGEFFKDDALTGNIGDKKLNLTVKEGVFKNTITGTLGNEPIDLKVSSTFNGYRIKGLFKNKDIDVKLNTKLIGYSLESENMSLKIKSKTLLGDDVKINGFYNDDPDLIPILMDLVYTLNNKQALMAFMVATNC